MINSFFSYGVYRLFLVPVALLLLKIFRPVLPMKIREMIFEREQENWVPLLTSPVWIHASSGEIEYAKSVVRELKHKYPELPLLVTYFSPSAKRLLQHFHEADLVMPLPWDSPALAQKFLNFYKPRAGLFARTDVWPTFTTEARKNKIPLLLFAATLSDESSRTKRWARPLTRWAMTRLDHIFAVTAEDERNFKNLSPRIEVSVGGDTRFDQALHRLREVSKLPTTLQPRDQDFTFVAGSTWPEDEEVLLPALPDMVSSGVRVILAPHEVDESHLEDLEQRLAILRLRSQRFSKSSQWPAHSVLIIDQIGWLADLYRWGNVAFVGGSFKEKVHSVMEPLAAGLPVLLGPYHTNNREALQFQGVRLSNTEFAVRVLDGGSRDVLRRVIWWQNTPSVKAELAGLTARQAGASKRVVAWVENELGLPKTSPV